MHLLLDSLGVTSSEEIESYHQTAAIASRVVLARLSGSVQFNPRINSWQRLAAASPDTPPYPLWRRDAPAGKMFKRDIDT